MDVIIEAFKVGFLKWEAAVPHKTVIYFFTGLTKAGAIRKAERYMKTLENDGTTT